MFKLSVLICSHPRRYKLLERVKEQLGNQIGTLPVEVIVDGCLLSKDKGLIRNRLLGLAQGEYCCFVDDDDIISDDYIDKILLALESRPDVCGMNVEVTSIVNNLTIPLHLSTLYNKIFSIPSNDIEDGWYKRFISHLNPIRLDIAKETGFPENDVNEDNGYSKRLMALNRDWNEVQIPDFIYHYFNRCKLL